MNGATPLDKRERVEKVSDLVRLLARKPNRFVPFHGSWFICLAVKDRPTCSSGRMSKRTRLIPLFYSASSHGLGDIDDATPNLQVLDRRECPDEFEALGGRQEVGHGARLTIDDDWPIRALI